MYNSLVSFLALLVLSSAKTLTTTTTTSVPSSCRGLKDGVQNLKFLGDDYPLVSLKCSKEFAILDYQQDENIKDYFVSWTQWHYNTVGPTNDDDSKNLKWNEWFIPGSHDPGMKYIISPDCDSCEETHKRQIYGPETTYWMTGAIFGCFWSIKGQHNCDVDWDTDECYSCSGQYLTNSGSTQAVINDDSTPTDYSSTGICPHSVQSASHNTPQSHDDCTHEESDINSLKLKPALGISGKYCVCVQSGQQQQQQTYMAIDDLKSKKEFIKSDILQSKKELTSENNQVLLYQSDFESGTYRIKESGTYIIMEDIEFNFNSNYDTPNSDRAWMPKIDQQDSYPGAGDSRDSYFMGFFAGITIEANDVILDLNDHTIKMSEHFYYQQRWFTTIELSTQYFLPGQGIGNFGGNPSIASDVTIKNGILGLTSHHGIHGNYNQDIVIENVKVQNFETHGIQFNGFSNIILRDVEVGPSSTQVHFNAEYGHARFLLPRYQSIAEDSNDQKIHFYGRDKPTTMTEIVEKLEMELDMAWNYVVNGIELTKEDDNYDLFVEAIRLFINPKGITNGAAQYGIFLNTFGASIFSYNLYTGYWSTSATLENVKIHDLKHSLTEYSIYHIYKSGEIIVNPFNAPLDVEEMFDDPKSPRPFYAGNVILDAIIASNKFSDNWGYLQLQLVRNNFLVPWATGEDLNTIHSTPVQLGCNGDAMIHSGKGINGLRLDGVEDVKINNLEVYNIHESTPLGSDLCGNYDTFDMDSGESGGHFRQTLPMQSGFSGNMNQAININAAKNIIFENIKINNIESETGAAFGISIWPACDVELKGDINVDNIIAGSTITKNTFTYDDRPNKAPEACAVRVYYQYDDYTTTVKYDQANIQSSCIVGHVGCLGEDTYSMLGDFISVDQCQIGDIPNNNNRKSFLSSLSLYIPKQTITYMVITSLIILSIIYGLYYYYYRKNNNKLNENMKISYYLINNDDYGSI